MERRPSGQKPVLGAEVVETFRRNAGPGLGAGETTDQFRVVQVAAELAARFRVARRALEKDIDLEIVEDSRGRIILVSLLTTP